MGPLGRGKGGKGKGARNYRWAKIAQYEAVKTFHDFTDIPEWAQMLEIKAARGCEKDRGGVRYGETLGD